MEQFEPIKHGGRNIPLNNRFPAIRADHALDKAGTEFTQCAGRHEKNSRQIRIQIRVDIAHASFVLVVVFVADASDDEVGPDPLGVVGEKLVLDGGDFDIVVPGCNFFEPGDSFLDFEGVFFFGVFGDGDDELVEKVRSLLDHPHMAVGWGVEAAGVDGSAVHFGRHDGTADVHTALTALVKMLRPGVGPDFVLASRRVANGWRFQSSIRSGWGMSPKISPVGSQTAAMRSCEPLMFLA